MTLDDLLCDARSSLVTGLSEKVVASVSDIRGKKLVCSLFK